MGPMGSFPFIPPWMIPWNQGQEREGSIPDIIVPARVEKALQFFSMVTSKTMKRIAATEHAIESFDGQNLTDEEQTAMATACNLLTKYFGGALPHDPWEQLRYTAVSKQLENDNHGPGHVLKCIACCRTPNMQPQSSCELCHGSGKLLVMSVGGSDTVNQAGS